MDEVLSKILELKKQVEEFKTVDEGSVFSKEAYASVKNSWLNLCILEDKFHSLLTSIRCTPGIAATIIINVNHTESIQILNTLLSLVSNVNVLKHLQEFNDSIAPPPSPQGDQTAIIDSNEIVYAMQSFKMNRCKYQMQTYLSSLYEIIINNKKDIELWIKNGSERMTRKSSMHM
jgi:hypothetical protein